MSAETFDGGSLHRVDGRSSAEKAREQKCPTCFGTGVLKDITSKPPRRVDCLWCEGTGVRAASSNDEAQRARGTGDA